MESNNLCYQLKSLGSNLKHVSIQMVRAFYISCFGSEELVEGFCERNNLFFCEIWIQMCPHSIYWSHNIWFKIQTQWLHFFFSRLELFSSLVSDWFWYLMRIFLCPMFPYGNQFYKFLSIERQTQKLNGTKCVECFIVVLPILYWTRTKKSYFLRLLLMFLHLFYALML